MGLPAISYSVGVQEFDFSFFYGVDAKGGDSGKGKRRGFSPCQRKEAVKRAL